jgi:kynurenine formamidase
MPGLQTVLPPFHIEAAATLENGSFFSSKFTATTLSGVYLESQAHLIRGGKTLDQYPVERFIVPATILKLPPQAPGALIDADLLAAHAPRIQKGEALLLATGWGTMWNRPGYVMQCPTMKGSAMDWVVEKGVSLFGVDIPCIEAQRSEDPDEINGNLLRRMFERDTLLLAPLVNLESVGSDHGTLVCMPLKLKGASGAPCRAVFVE